MKLSGKLALMALIITAIFFNHPVHAQEQKNGLTWYTDVNKAYELSKQTKKPIFGFFTGSDWCIWCHRLEENVFDKPGFKEWAKKNVILLELDFPRNKRLPDELARQNGGLEQFFKVQGFPTIWMFYMDKDKAANKFKISALGSLGYPRCEPGKEEVTFLGTANDIIKRKNKSVQ
ncbi:MAG TPA: thioredoxin family protein [Flavipsychrobacter sp.]|nr:thioredoxin family protein [Flavipsychrobacter sp.]